MSLKIICVEFENLKQFADGKFRVDFFATDRVLKKSEMFKISSNVAMQNVMGFVGLNATGKTTALRLLKTALEIVIRNTDLNQSDATNLIVDGTIIRTTFFIRKPIISLNLLWAAVMTLRKKSKLCTTKQKRLRLRGTSKFIREPN